MSWTNAWDLQHQEMLEVDAWLQSLPMALAEAHEGAIDSLCNRAARGKLAATDDDTPIVAVASQPDLFELRWKFDSREGDDVRFLRQYHAEPDAKPQLLVRTHRHLKWIEGTAAEIEDRQNKSMAVGQEMYNEWLKSNCDEE